MIYFNTWTLQDLPQNRKAIASKWVFDVKPSLAGDGSVRKFKARLVIKGFSQRAGIDYSETFAPVAHMSSLKVVLTIAAQENLTLRQIDVVGAFLNGDIDGEIYMKQPDGFAVQGQRQKVCKLNKALYGLKQAGMIWNRQLDEFLTNILSFTRTVADPCVYHYMRQSTYAIMLIHVDDILIAHNDEIFCNDLILSFQEQWDVTDLGSPTRLLGMQINRDQTGSIFLHQEDYVQEILQRFNMVECKPASTPHQPGYYLSVSMSPTSDEKKNDMKTVPYSELVGSLNWLATNTRPNIANAVGTLCRFISNPGRQHWKAAQMVLRYLSGSADHGIKFSKSDQGLTHSLIGYSDADWAGNPDTRRSTTGFVFTLGGNPISWKSKLQQSTALSSVEAEYIALCEAGREAKWIRQLLNELNFAQSSSTVIFDDNRGCISISENNRTDARTKHIDVKYHFVRPLIRNQQIQVKYLSTDEMLADIFTKPSSAVVFRKFAPRLVVPRTADLRGRVGNQTASPGTSRKCNITSLENILCDGSQTRHRKDLL